MRWSADASSVRHGRHARVARAREPDRHRVGHVRARRARSRVYGDARLLGAITAKSVSVTAWQGKPAPRLHMTAAGMLNAVGLQGPGVAAWIEHDLPALRAVGARVIASIWGHTVDDFARAPPNCSGPRSTTSSRSK